MHLDDEDMHITCIQIYIYIIALYHYITIKPSKMQHYQQQQQAGRSIHLSEKFIDIFYEKYFRDYGDITYNMHGESEFRHLNPILWVIGTIQNPEDIKETMYDTFHSIFYIYLKLNYNLLPF